ncbi:MAG: ABC transporter ATP-binding protein, partial [Actinobacteria bacterium]
RENIYLNASILGFKKKEVDEIFDDIVEFASIGEFIDTPVKHYSSGMFVRLGFAVAINVEPDILLIDEVLAVGDEQFQRKCNEKILQFKRQKKTIIIVSHALEELRTLCDEALWLHKGKLKKSGRAEDVIDSYLKEVYLNEEQLADGRAKQIGEYGRRWGSGEAQITKVEFLDEEGKKKTFFKTGDKMIVRINYKTNKKIEKPVFGFAVHTDQGLHLSGPNTRLSNNTLDYIDGEGTVEYHIKSLPFLKGKYLCSAAIYDYSCRHPYDHQEEMHVFEIADGTIKETYGVLHMPAKWEVK